MNKYIDIKAGCKFKRFTPQLATFIMAVIRTWDLHTPAIVPVITSANDSKHMRESKHYKDEAWDLRTNNIPDAGKIEEIARTLRVDLGNDYDVVVENDLFMDGVQIKWKHIHVEWDKGV